MAKKKTGQEEISQRLHEAIDGLRKDVTRVEIWATALGSFAQPVPDYTPNPKFALGSDQGGPADGGSEKDEAASQKAPE